MKYILLLSLLVSGYAYGQVNPENQAAITPQLTDNVYTQTRGTLAKFSLQDLKNLIATGGSAHLIADDGTVLAQLDTLDFVGDGVSATNVGGKTVVTINDQDLSYNLNTGEIAISGNGTNATILVMGGANGVSGGYRGLVPPQAAGDNLKFLRGDGTWADPAVGGAAIAGSAVDESYPIRQFYKNSFTDSLANWANFSAGTRALGTGANAGTMRVIKTVRWNGEPFIEGQTYYAQIFIRDAGQGVLFYDEWSDLATIDTLRTGYNEVIWTQAVDGGGDELPVLNAIGNDTAFIDYIHFYIYNDENLLLTKDETVKAIGGTTKGVLGYTDGHIWSHDFNRYEDAAAITPEVAGINWPGVNTTARYMDGDDLVWESNGSGGLELGYLQFPLTAGVSPDYRYGQLVLDVDATDASLWIGSDNGFRSTDTIRNFNGVVAIPFRHFNGNMRPGLRLKTEAGDVVRFRSASINWTKRDERVTNAPKIGLYSYGTGTIYGQSATAMGQNIAIGQNAYSNPLNNTDGTSLAIGANSISNAWRSLAVGGGAFANAVSSTALGTGAYANDIHGLAIGRGSWVPDQPDFGFYVGMAIGGDLADNLYLGNSWGHVFPTTPSGMGLGTVVPSTKEIKFHGWDAFDARPSPSDLNVGGGDLGLYAGRATGTGESGSINFYVAEGGNGANVKDADVKAGEFRSEQAVTDGTHFYLLNVATGTMQRVRIGAAGTGPGGTGKALYID